MCDTIVALGEASKTGSVLFGKNSDRHRDEAQAVEVHGGRNHVPGAAVQCTYLTIPQAPHTNTILIGRPWWMWGAEMGVNEHGVAIGNEAVTPRDMPKREDALLGMDLVRLGLERGRNAEEAVEIIIALLEQYGQGGNCAWPGSFYYDNSFIVADRHEAFVLETADRDWMVERVDQTRSISNSYTIASPSRASKRLSGVLAGSGEANAADLVGDRSQEYSGPERFARTSKLLQARKHGHTVASLMRILRDHGPGTEADMDWRPTGPRQGRVCSHADDEKPIGQTVNSMVCEIGDADVCTWMTASSTPCLSVFKPIFLDCTLPAESVDLPAWRRRDSAQRTLLAYEESELAVWRADCAVVERQMIDRIAAVSGEPRNIRQEVVDDCWASAAALEEILLRTAFDGRCA